MGIQRNMRQSLPGIVLGVVALLAPARIQAGEPVAGPTPDDGRQRERVVALDDGGSAFRLEAGLEALSRESPFAAAWTWSDEAAPLRVQRESFGKPLPEARRDGAVEVELQLGGQREVPEGVELIAAPQEMWDEVGEDLLPHFRWGPSARLSIPCSRRGSPQTLRLAGRDWGSWWTQVSGCPAVAKLELAPARPIDVAIEVGDGPAKNGASVTLLDPSRKDRFLTFVRIDRGASLHFAGIPKAATISLVASAPGGVPRTLTATVLGLPGVIRLDLGARVSGRVVRRDHAPIRDAEIASEAWLDHGGIYRRETTSDDSGYFELEPLPRSPLVVAVRRSGFAPRRLSLTPDGPTVALGEVVLERGVSVELEVVDAKGIPIRGARLSADGHRETETDERGRAELAPVAPDEPLRIATSADGFLDSETEIAPPFRRPVRIALEREYSVSGRVVDSRHVPQASATVRIDEGNSFRDEPVDGDGTFALRLDASRPLTLLVRSAQSLERRVEVPRGAPGQVRDLGDIVLAAGRGVQGTVVDCGDGAKLSGARIWTLRPGPGGPALAALVGDQLETRSDAKGRFRLVGLSGAETWVQVEAPGRARKRVSLDLSDRDEMVSDLGAIELCGGSTVLVRMPDDRSSGAQVSLETDPTCWGFDPIVGLIMGDVAELRSVPPGEALVKVRLNRREVCSRQIVVPDDGEDLEVDCPRFPRVAGTVTRGGTPAGPGTLVWQQPGSGASGAIMNRSSEEGAVSQQVLGVPALPVSVAVDASGYFATEEIAPGAWRVSFSERRGSPMRPLRVEVPEVSDFQTQLAYPSYRIEGTVVNEAGASVDSARVTDLHGRAFAITDWDGGFLLDGLDPGRYSIRAATRDASSDWTEVELAPDAPVASLQLELRKGNRKALEVSVVTPSGEPVVSALVVAEGSNGETRMTTTDFRGRASVTWLEPLPERVRASARAGAWAFGDWTRWTEDGATIPLVMSGGGTLEITTDQAEDRAMIEAPGGWRLDLLLLRVGQAPSLSRVRPLLLTGLPLGSYQVRTLRVRQTVAVTGGEPVVVGPAGGG